MSRTVVEPSHEMTKNFVKTRNMATFPIPHLTPPHNELEKCKNVEFDPKILKPEMQNVENNTDENEKQSGESNGGEIPSMKNFPIIIFRFCHLFSK